MRVLLVNDHDPSGSGGAEIHLSRLASALTAEGDDVALFAGEVTHEGWRRVLDLWDPAARRAVAARAEGFGADVVHHHNVLRELSPSVLGATPDFPTVLTVHDHRILGRRDRTSPSLRVAADVAHRRLALREIRRHVDAVVAVSPPLADELRVAGLPEVTHIPPVVPAPSVDPAPVADCRDVLYVGRLDPDKGVTVLVEAFRRIAGDHPGTELVLVGDGTLRSALARIGGPVRVAGPLEPDEVSRQLGRARVVVVPSVRLEGLGLVALEAAAHARPVVASDQPALRHSVQDGRSGLLVPAGDADALAAAIGELLHDGERAVALGRAAREQVGGPHTPSAVATATRTLYRRLGADRG